jgi:hypothetical protein
MPTFIQTTYGFGTGNGLKALVYGPPSSGKTESLSTLPNPLILSVEGGLLTLRKKNIPFITVPNYAALQYFTGWLTQSREGMMFDVGIDSLSEIAELILLEEEAKTKDGRMAYREMGKKVTELVRFYRDLPNRNVVMTAKQDWEKDEVTGGMHNRPSMPGKKIATDLPYFFDEVFQANRFPVQNGKDQFAFRTKPDTLNIAKDRSGVLDDWELPDFNSILHKINSKG